MSVLDNKSSHLSLQYDAQIRATIPYYDSFHKEAMNLVEAHSSVPDLWLDTGCGTGNLVEKAHNIFLDTKFVLADPSNEMQEVAKTKFSVLDEKIVFLPPMQTQDLTEDLVGNPDVITAIQAHHYLKPEERREATKVCYHLLNKKGLYITFENIRPMSEKCLMTGLQNWKNFQIEHGKSAEEAEKHIERFDKEYFPITIEEHLALLKESGFRFVEMLWYSCMQAGFYAIK
jgi:tRNA (cmo5U34)-methyltransferase